MLSIDLASFKCIKLKYNFFVYHQDQKNEILKHVMVPVASYKSRGVCMNIGVAYCCDIMNIRVVPWCSIINMRVL